MNTARHLDLTIIMPIAPGADPKPAIRAIERSIPKGVTTELITVTGTHPTRQRNLAAFRAQGKILWFLDHDSIPARDAAALLLREFRDPDAAVAGGPNLAAKARNGFERNAARVIASPLGSPFVQDRYASAGSARSAGEHALILCNLAVRRDEFLAAGGFDPRLYPNEENEFMNRMAASGRRMMHIPEAWVRKPRPQGLVEYLRESFRYGKGRAEQIWIWRSTADILHLAGTACVVAGLVGFVLVMLSVWKMATGRAAADALVPAMLLEVARFFSNPPHRLLLPAVMLLVCLYFVRQTLAFLILGRWISYAAGMCFGGVLGWRKRSLKLGALPAVFSRFPALSGRFRISESSSFDLGSITMKGAFRHA